MLQWVFLAGSFTIAFLVASIFLAMRRSAAAAAQEQREARGEQEPPKPVLTRATVEANIAVDQWEVIESRLGRAILLDDEQTSSWPSSTLPKKCIGLISLDVDNAYRVKELRAIPLLRAVRDRLVGLGFRISDDRLWATYVEEGAVEEDEKAVSAEVLARIDQLSRPKW